MSLAIKYETVEDARLRLKNTVVLYRGAPVMITEVSRGEDNETPFRVFMKELPIVDKAAPRPRGARVVLGEEPEDGAKRKYISSKHFDIAPFKMGYVNKPEGVFYCSRLPNRVQRQGLCHENFMGQYNDGKIVDFYTFTNCKESVAMVAGDYPSFDEAMQIVKKAPSVAFDRDFSLQKDETFPQLIFMYHKGIKAGVIVDGNMTLSKKHVCLKENLGELKVKVAA